MGFLKKRFNWSQDYQVPFQRKFLATLRVNFMAGLDAGVRFNRNKGSLDVLLNYQFSSNVTYRYPFDSISIDIDNQKTEHYDAEGNRIRFAFSSLLRSHLVGLSLKYNFKKEGKIVKPFISIQVLTEVGSNFKNGYLMYGSFIPSHTNSGQQSSGSGDIFLASNFYYSTPLIGSALVGINIKFSENISLNIAAGYAFRRMKVKYAEWKEDDNVYEKLKTIPTKNINSHMIDVQLGLTYAFSLKKKEQK